MAHVEALARGIGELDQTVKLGPFAPVGGGKDLALLPALLPFRLNGGKIVFQNHHTLFILSGHNPAKISYRKYYSEFSAGLQGFLRSFPSLC